MYFSSSASVFFVDDNSSSAVALASSRPDFSVVASDIRFFIVEICISKFCLSISYLVLSQLLPLDLDSLSEEQRAATIIFSTASNFVPIEFLRWLHTPFIGTAQAEPLCLKRDCTLPERSYLRNTVDSWMRYKMHRNHKKCNMHSNICLTLTSRS